MAPVIDRRATRKGLSCREETGRQLRKPYIQASFEEFREEGLSTYT